MNLSTQNFFYLIRCARNVTTFQRQLCYLQNHLIDCSWLICANCLKLLKLVVRFAKISAQTGYSVTKLYWDPRIPGIWGLNLLRMSNCIANHTKVVFWHGAKPKYQTKSNVIMSEKWQFFFCIAHIWFMWLWRIDMSRRRFKNVGIYWQNN